MSSTQLELGEDAPDVPDEIPETAQTIIDAIQSVEQVGDATAGFNGVEAEDGGGLTTTGGRLPGLDLPGFGDEPMQDDCGEKQPHFCDECGKAFKQGRTCQQSRCPRCWQSWCVDLAEKWAGKLDTVARVKANRTGEAHHKHHVSIMLPPDWRPTGGPRERIETTKQVIKEIITEAWDAEGAAVYHGWSGSGYGEDESPAGGDDRGEWKDRLDPENRDWEGDVRDELYNRPHFHCIVTAPSIPGDDVTAAIHQETGWVIRRFYDEETNRSISGKGPQGEMKALARVLTYCLSHTSIDCSGDSNDAIMGQWGSVWWDGQVKVLKSVERSAKRAVRAVAPLTLGVQEKSVRCTGKIAPERAPDAQEHHTHDHGEEEDGDGDSEPSAPSGVIRGRVVDVDESAGTATLSVDGGTRTVDVDGFDLSVGDQLAVDPETGEVELEDPRVDCQGGVRHISDAAEFVSSGTWTDRAQFAEETKKMWRWWKGDPPP